MIFVVAINEFIMYIKQNKNNILVNLADFM